MGGWVHGCMHVPSVLKCAHSEIDSFEINFKVNTGQVNRKNILNHNHNFSLLFFFFFFFFIFQSIKPR